MIPTAVHDLHPEAADLLARAHDLSGAPALAACRARIRSVLTGVSDGIEAASGSLLGAQLDFAEQFAFAVASLDDAQVAALRQHMSEAGVWAFVTAVYQLDQAERLTLVAEAVL